VGVLEAVKNVVSTRSGVTALWVTHRLEELPFADGAAYMHGGKVVMHGSPGKIERYIGRLQKQALALR
jgi:energy-coupling factor transport system ATP-binding protein